MIDIGDYAIWGNWYNDYVESIGMGSHIDGVPHFNGDLNGDGSVDIGDFAIISHNYGLYGMELSAV